MAETAAAPGRRFSIRISKRLAPYVFLLPFMLLFVAFLIIPLINALGLSVYKTTLVGGTRFVGHGELPQGLRRPQVLGRRA